MNTTDRKNAFGHDNKQAERLITPNQLLLKNQNATMPPMLWNPISTALIPPIQNRSKSKLTV